MIISLHDRLRDKCEWNIKDATEALMLAIEMKNWDNVIKYAGQVKDWEHKLYMLETLIKRGDEVNAI